MAQQRGARWNYRQNITKFFESAQNKSYTILGLTFISLIVFGAFAIRPTIVTITKLRKKVAEGREIEAKMQEKIDTLYALQKLIYDNERKIELSESSFPSDSNIDTIIANVDLIAQKYDLTLLSLTPVDGTSSASVSDLSTGIIVNAMRVMLEGSPENFQKFIEHVETLPRDIYVTRLNITEEGSEEIRTMAAEIYYFYYEE